MSPRKSRRPRLALLLGLAIVCIVAGGAFGVLGAANRPQWNGHSAGDQTQATTEASPEPSKAVEAAAADAITLAATGDNVMGGPGNWPPNNGKDIYKKQTDLKR